MCCNCVGEVIVRYVSHCGYVRVIFYAVNSVWGVRNRNWDFYFNVGHKFSHWRPTRTPIVVRPTTLDGGSQCFLCDALVEARPYKVNLEKFSLPVEEVGRELMQGMYELCFILCVCVSKNDQI